MLNALYFVMLPLNGRQIMCDEDDIVGWLLRNGEKYATMPTLRFSGNIRQNYLLFIRSWISIPKEPMKFKQMVMMETKPRVSDAWLCRRAPCSFVLSGIGIF